MKNNLLKYPFLIFLLFSIALRFFSFFPSVIDHDESTYLQIGKELLFGKIYFVDVIDVKPPGIFLITAFIQKIFGDSIFLFRLICAGYIALTSFVIYKIKLKISNSWKGAYAAGILYIMMVSTYTYYGISVNIEMFFNLFTLLALLVFIREWKGNYFIAGLLLGLGFMIKQSVLFEYIAFGSFFLVSHIYANKKLQIKYFGRLLTSLGGFVLPFLLTCLYYFSKGHLNSYLFYAFEVPASYPVERSIGDTSMFILDFHVRFLPIAFFFYFVLFKMKIRFQGLNLKTLMITWCCFALISILYSGKPFGHYFIQIMPVVCITASGFFHYKFSEYSFYKKIIRSSVISGTLILASAIIVFFQKKDYYDKPDIPFKISQYLKQDLNKDDQVYVHGYHQIIYYLLDRSSPNKYIHRSLIFEKSHIDVLDIDLNAVTNSIIKSNPRYIIESGQIYFKKLNDYKKKNYTLVKSFMDKIPVDIFKRNG